MKNRWGTLALVVTVAACSDEPTSAGLSLADLSGDWDCTEYLLVDFADQSNTFDFLTDAGISLSLEIRSDGRVILFIDGTPSDTSTATLNGDILEYSGSSYRVALSGNNMTMTGRDTIAYDFDSDGTDEDAFEGIKWLRN